MPPRRFQLRCSPLLIAALLSAPTYAADATPEAMQRLLEKMNARLEQLEKRNDALEKQLKAQASSSVLDTRVQALEDKQAQLNQALDSDNISENEPELVYRLKAVEKDTLDVKKAGKKVDALDGVKVGMSLSMVAQRPAGLPKGTLNGNSQLSYRSDLTVELPLTPIGDIEHKLFTHIRVGQGAGLNAPMTALGAFASAPNALAFRASGASPDDSVAILGQAWYQASIPLPFGGFKPRSREKLELTFGKMDLFAFFDQNAAAGDESRQFLNSVFVHNPLLDAGGQIGVDANGFQPGFVASYFNETGKPENWRVSLGVFGNGPHGANYQRTLTAPLLIAQAETSRRFFGGLTGNYRVYGWQRSQGLELDGSTAPHHGWGLSVDQRIGDGLNLFARYGQQTRGAARFDRALTFGGEISGGYWSRGGDSLGVASALLHASNALRSVGGSVDLDGDGVADFGYAPSGSEKLSELYYRYRISKQFELSPNFQHIARLGGNPNVASVKIVGLRALFVF